jgi:hypothetical protein
LIPVESVTDSAFAKCFDQHAGIDAWQLKTDRGLRGIASRVQWDDQRRDFPYCTFTVRHARDSGAETEYTKRLRALREKGGWLFPYLAVQAFFTQPKRAGEILTCAVAKTEDVIDMIARDLCRLRRTSNASFWAVPWDEMRNQGYAIWAWSQEKGGRFSVATAEIAATPQAAMKPVQLPLFAKGLGPS